MQRPRASAPPRRHAANRVAATLLVAAAAATFAGQAAAQTSPWYLGVVQSFGYESNLYRIADEQQLAPDLSRSDTLSITSLIGGVDQRIGRQRVYGSMNVRANRFANNEGLNNESYGLDLALDWETLERLSGTVRVAADQAAIAAGPRSCLPSSWTTPSRVKQAASSAGVPAFAALK